MKINTLLITTGLIICFNNESIGQTTGLQFDGVNDYVSIQHNSAYDIGYGNFTIEATVTLNPVQTATNYPALLSTRSSGDNSGFLLFFFNGELSLQTDGQNHSSTPNGDIRDGQCHHVAVVRSATNLLSWYIDGQLTTTNPDANYDISTSGPMIIGNDFFSGNISAGAFKGMIQEVRVWNVARTQAELQSAMNLSVGSNETGLIANWRLNDGSGQVAVDNSLTNNPGSLGSTISTDVNDPVFSNGCPVTGILELEENVSDKDTYIIYPNPLTSNAILQFNEPVVDAEVMIYDILGKVMMNKKVTGNTVEIEKGEMASGTYFVRVTIEGAESIQKIIIE